MQKITTFEQSNGNSRQNHKNVATPAIYVNTNANVNLTQPTIANMVERFVQTIGQQLNDSGSFDASFEVKHIRSPQREQLCVRHRCVTELDRKNLMQFVRDFEARQAMAANTTPKCSSPYLCRKARELYQCARGAGSGSRYSSPLAKTPTMSIAELDEQQEAVIEKANPDAGAAVAQCTPAVQRVKSAEAEDLIPAPNALQRAQPERSSCRSANKVLQFFSAKKKCRKSPNETKLDWQQPEIASPVLLRAELGCQTLSASDPEDNDDDDGISSASSNFTTQSSTTSSASRNTTPDSSFEMHAPLLPTFRLTPPKAMCKAGKNAAYEFARFLRGSFHAKRATITTLRRSLSDPESMEQLDFTKASCIKATTVGTTDKPTSKGGVLCDTTNVIRNRELPANASPFRRAWGQSSFRTERCNNNKLGNNNNNDNKLHGNSIVRRTASMTASENDVHIKSMDGFFDDLNSRQSRSSLKQSQQKMGVQVPKICTELSSQTKTMSATANPAEKLIDGPSGVAAWGTSFERMLQDRAGMQTFAEFLKKEFSAENIYFWTACERYRHLDSEEERVAEARAIFAKHLSNTGTDPVNVDSQARNLSEEKLSSAELDIFAPAQKQILNLMKFDSYQRFIRSDLYKSCLEADEKHKALPYSGEDLDELLKINFHVVASSKLKKSTSNAEDRRRKSLLPWHRKTRSKSRDRNELLTDAMTPMQSAKLNLLMPAPAAKLSAPLSSSSLKIPSSTQNSLSDIYSSRSSLSSFDAGVSNAAQNAEQVCSLCRVILSDGATTIVQTRANETVGQLVERLLEKRGLSYQYYDVVYNGCSKSIDMQLPAQTLAGKEVLIEQRVAFKLDLPDPKVISVKSKPKKQLHEVIRPILHKYNYSMTGVQVLLRDTHAILDLNQPVTTADGQRLQVVITQPTTQMLPDFQQSGGSNLPPKCLKPTLSKMANSNVPPTVAKRTTTAVVSRNSLGAAVVGMGATVATAAATPQSTLDEITNKVFNELLQGKVEKQRSGDLYSLKSEDCASETSSIFDRIRRRDSNIPGNKLPKFQKKKSTSSQHSEDVAILNAHSTSSVTVDPKKPIIAKLKAGVKLQVTERVAENQDELLEGLKRAQLARLEDQRGTEINFELPEFLKHKENINAAATKLRKARANLSPINKPTSPITMELNSTLNAPTTVEPPQPAPRPSITQRNKNAVSPMKIDEISNEIEENGSSIFLPESPSSVSDCNINAKGPPPLPPKPKVLPIKPSNWGATTTTTTTSIINYGSKPLANSVPSNLSSPSTPTSKIPIDIGRKSLLAVEQTATRCAYLDEPSSSFV